MNSETIYQGRVITLTREGVQLPNGKQTTMDIVRHPGGVVIIAIDPQDRVCLIRQYRHSIADWIWEVPAGTLISGEQTLTAAARELREEAGLEASAWTLMTSCYPAPGFCDEILHIYRATQLTTTEQQLDDDECIEVHWLPLQEALNWAMDGTIKDAKTMLALFHASR